MLGRSVPYISLAVLMLYGGSHLHLLNVESGILSRFCPSATRSGFASGLMSTVKNDGNDANNDSLSSLDAVVVPPLPLTLPLQTSIVFSYSEYL